MASIEYLQHVFFCVQQKKETHTGLDQLEGECILTSFLGTKRYLQSYCKVIFWIIKAIGSFLDYDIPFLTYNTEDQDTVFSTNVSI